ncbi:MAG: hypothetical protein IIB57_02935 [Planctomycetes bacterium]|nr:hypothetical protein [Planctomycetota bacterium]
MDPRHLTTIRSVVKYEQTRGSARGYAASPVLAKSAFGGAAWRGMPNVIQEINTLVMTDVAFMLM